MERLSIFKYKSALFYSMCAIFFLLMSVLSYAATYSFQQLGWDKSVSLNGYKPVYNLYLPIPKNRQVKNILLHAVLSFSPSLTPGTRVVIQFNDYMVRELSIPQDTNVPLSVDIELPLTQLTATWQKITFLAYLESSKNLCDPDVWIYLLPDSFISVDYDILPFKPSLNKLPYPFVDSGSLESIPTLILFPTSPSSAEINALFQILIRLGEVAGDNKISIKAGEMSSFEKNELDNANLIVLGLANRLIANNDILNYQSIFDKPDVKTALTNNLGILSLNPSPFNPQFGLLIITGNTNQSFHTALKAFTVPEFKSLASGDLALIKDIVLTQKQAGFQGMYQTTYSQLGYDDRSVSGLGRHTLSYTLPLPYNQSPMQTTIKTFITAPLFLNDDISQMTLLVNGVRQSSIQLLKEHTVWETELDADALKPGINKLDYLIDLHLEHENCKLESFDQVWATIHAQSRVKTIFSKQFPKAMLNQLPVPFAKKINIILPETFSMSDVTKLAPLFLKFGQLFSDNLPQVFFYRSNQIDEDFIHQNDLIVVGTPASNPWINVLFDYLPIQINGKQRIFVSKNRTLRMTDNTSVGLLELMSSPWGKHAVLLIAGDNQQSLEWAIDALASDKKREQLKGNVAIINQNQSIEVVNSYNPLYMSVRQKSVFFMRRLLENGVYFAKNNPQFFIYIFVIIIVPVVIFLRRKK